MPRARQKKLETKKIDVSTPRETLGSCASLSEFPRVRLHQNCFSSFLLAQRKGGTARSQVQLIHALLPLDVLTRGPRSPSKSVEKKANDSLNCLLERSCSFKSCFEIVVSTFPFVLCSELSTRYEFTQESSSSAKQEVDQLKEEVKVMSAQLLRQHNASLDSQVRSIYFIT